VRRHAFGCRDARSRRMSDIERTAENICSQRVFRLLTGNGNDGPIRVAQPSSCFGYATGVTHYRRRGRIENERIRYGSQGRFSGLPMREGEGIHGFSNPPFRVAPAACITQQPRPSCSSNVRKSEGIKPLRERVSHDEASYQRR